MYQELFRIPFIGLPVYGYGLMMVLGFLVSARLMRSLAAQHGFDPEVFVNAALLGLVTGVIGARLSHVLENLGEFTSRDRSAWENFRAMINISSGGLTFYGGFLFATPVLMWYAVRNNIPILKGMDIVAPCLMVGLAFGRMGCFLNGCCHGEECSLPWGVQFPFGSNAYIEQFQKDHLNQKANDKALSPPSVLRTGKLDEKDVPLLKSAAEVRQNPELAKVAARERARPVHPTQLYSVFNAAMIALACWTFLSLSPVPGRVFALMLFMKGISRFTLELIRVEPAVADTQLSFSMWVSITLVIAGIFMWFIVPGFNRGKSRSVN